MRINSQGGLTVVRKRLKRESGKVFTLVFRKSNLSNAVTKGKNNIIYG